MGEPAPLLLFALPGSEAQGAAVAAALGGEVAPLELRRFEDGERKLRALAEVRGQDAFVLCALHGGDGESVHDRLCAALFFVGSLVDAGARRVTVVAPYLCYARKDRRTNPRDPVATRYVARLLEAAGAARVVTVDVHNLAAYENAFRIGAEHLEARPLFAARALALAGGAPRGLAVVAPDPGGLHRAEALRDALEAGGGPPVELAALGKHRHGGVVRTGAFVGEVAGRVAIVVDDMIVTGTTLARAAEACRARGAVAVHAMATHGVFAAGAAAALASPALDGVVITDTLAPAVGGLGPAAAKLAVEPIAPLLARAIDALRREVSLTAARGG